MMPGEVVGKRRWLVRADGVAVEESLEEGRSGQLWQLKCRARHYKRQRCE
jgi:hypothetical protein